MPLLQASLKLRFLVLSSPGRSLFLLLWTSSLLLFLKPLVSVQKLPKVTQTMYEELKELFNISSNHKNYRDAILQSSPPLVPYLGLYGKFLLAIEDGNPGKVKEKMINLPKYKKLYKQISEIKRYQSRSYPFSVDQELQKLLLSTSSFRSPLSEEETFKLSLVAEPRTAASSSTSSSSLSPALVNAKGKPPGKRK